MANNENQMNAKHFNAKLITAARGKKGRLG
jgi:hypothetical protein